MAAHGVSSRRCVIRSLLKVKRTYCEYVVATLSRVSARRARGYRDSVSASGNGRYSAPAHSSGLALTIWSSLPVTKTAMCCSAPAYSPLLFFALNRRQTTYRVLCPTSWSFGSDAAATRICVGSLIDGQNGKNVRLVVFRPRICGLMTGIFFQATNGAGAEGEGKSKEQG